MPNSVLYGLTVAIWGTSWYVITLQTGVVPVAVAIAYRFLLSAAVLIAFCFATRRRLNYRARDHLFMAIQGVCLFSLNYILFYLASEDMPSGLMAVCFSTVLLMNIANGALFFRSPVDTRVLLGGLLGLCGLTLVFWPEVARYISRLAWQHGDGAPQEGRRAAGGKQRYRHGLWRHLLAHRGGHHADALHL
jgi:drug/metabolite transporter (DMT)-like permease